MCKHTHSYYAKYVGINSDSDIPFHCIYNTQHDTWLGNVGNHFKLNVSLQSAESNVRTASGCNVKPTERIIATYCIRLLFQFTTGKDRIKVRFKIWVVKCCPTFFFIVGEEACIWTADNPYFITVAFVIMSGVGKHATKLMQSISTVSMKLEAIQNLTHMTGFDIIFTTRESFWALQQTLT